MRKEYRIILLNIVVCCAFFAFGLLIAAHTHAQSSAPGLPFQLYGKVTNENGSILANVSITVEINGVQVAKSVTNTNGMYGLAPTVLMITDPYRNLEGKPLELLVGGVPINESVVFEAGALKEVNLKVTMEVSNVLSNKIQQTQATSSNSLIIEADSRSEKSTSSDEVIYRTPVFHLKKHQSRDAYQKHQENKANYHHSRFLGLASLTLLVIILSWVYFQNYLHKRRQNF